MNSHYRHLIVSAALLSGAVIQLAQQAHAQGGVPLWTNFYKGPGQGYDIARAVAADSGGNVFVTGESFGGSSYDYATLAFANSGVPLWTNRYEGPNDDRPLAMAVDRDGDVAVTGPATVAYSGAGVPLWTNTGFGGSAIAVDGSGNFIVMGGATIKYSSKGVPLWTNCCNAGMDGALDGSGNVFVTGTSTSVSGDWDYATIKYSSGGVPLWTNRYNGSGNSYDAPNAIAVDRNGNVFVTGRSGGNGIDMLGDDYVTVAYSSTGVPLWTNRYNGPANSHDEAYAVAVDIAGTVFVTGESWSGSGVDSSDADYATVAYSNSGLPLWTNRYNGAGNGGDIARSIGVDGDGNVFVTGNSYGAGSHFEIATLAYSKAGVPLWTNTYNGPNNHSSGTALAVDADGNVIITGDSYYIPADYSSFVIIKYSSSVLPRVHLILEQDGSGGFFIRFNGTPGASYRLQRARNLAGPWISSAPQTAPASGLLEFHDLFPPFGQAFYRTVQP